MALLRNIVETHEQFGIVDPDVVTGVKGWLEENHPPPEAYMAAVSSLAGKPLRDVAKPDAALGTLTYGQQEALRVALRVQANRADVNGWINHVNDDGYSIKQIHDIADGHKQLVAALERVAGSG